MTITNGGNIEFVFNSIDDYRMVCQVMLLLPDLPTRLQLDAFYINRFYMSSSTRWSLTYGSEEITFIGTDDPANTLDLTNVGFTLVSTGTHIFEAAGGAQGTDLNAESMQCYHTRQRE